MQKFIYAKQKKMPVIPAEARNPPGWWVDGNSYTTNSSIYLEIAYYMF